MDNKPIKTTRILSFKYAFEGILAAIKQEPNIKIHILIAIVTVTFGFLLNITRSEWIAIIIVMGLVFTLELTNTAIETVVNSFTDEHHPRAKLAKDIAAGAVLTATITSAIVGLIIFMPYLTKWI